MIMTGPGDDLSALVRLKILEDSIIFNSRHQLVGGTEDKDCLARMYRSINGAELHTKPFPTVLFQCASIQSPTKEI
jgi:hypothetical protein